MPSLTGLDVNAEIITKTEVNLYLFDQAIQLRKGTYPWDGTVGCGLPDLIGQPTSPQTVANANLEVLEAAGQSQISVGRLEDASQPELGRIGIFMTGTADGQALERGVAL